MGQGPIDQSLTVSIDALLAQSGKGAEIGAEELVDVFVEFYERKLYLAKDESQAKLYRDMCLQIQSDK